MEFWGAEVKSGETLSVQPGDGMVLHLSQASLGEVKKEKSDRVCLSVNIEDKKLVLGTLSLDKMPQQQFDLVFDRDFELSHNSKSGSVYFFGYKAANPFEEEMDDEDDEDESDEEIPLTLANNGKPEAKAAEKSNAAKGSASGKQKVKIVEPSKDVKADDEDDSSDEDDMSEDEDDSDMGEGEDDSDESDDESEEETPKKAEASKKRPAGSATKTPSSDKKAKFSTPQKTDGKKGNVHVATPHPSKQAGKTTPSSKNQQTPKSGGSHMCTSCNRGFVSDKALESHSKAKHSASK